MKTSLLKSVFELLQTLSRLFHLVNLLNVGKIFLELNLLGCSPSPPARAPEWSITQSSFSYGTELSFRKTILNLYLRS